MKRYTYSYGTYWNAYQHCPGLIFRFLLRFWFIILSIISGLAILFSAILIMMPTSRERIIKRRFRHASSKEVERLVRCLDVSFIVCKAIK